MTLEDARRLLSERHYGNVAERLVQNRKVPPQQILGTDPPAGMMQAPVEWLTLLVADPIGPPGSKVKVPRLLGKHSDVTEAELRRAKIAYRIDPKGDLVGVVVRVHPKAGTLVKTMTREDLVPRLLAPMTCLP